MHVSRHKGTIKRVPRGKTPAFELPVDLGDGAYVADLQLDPHTLFTSDRKTIDWDWTAVVVTPAHPAPKDAAVTPSLADDRVMLANAVTALEITLRDIAEGPRRTALEQLLRACEEALHA